MDAIKAQLLRIQQQLQGLSASQRMLVAALVAVMVLTLMLWGRYAGTSEMEPVLSQDFAPEDITRITASLAGKGINYRVQGNQILVPADRKFEVLADLSFSSLMPSDTRRGYDEMISKMTPFDPQSKTEALRTDALGLFLSQVIRGFPGVARADVILDRTRERRIGGDLHPTAMVNLSMRSGAKPDKRLVVAAADTVAGAVAGLQRKWVKVIIDGAPYPVPDGDSGSLYSSGEMLDQLQAAERAYAEKIQNQLQWIPGAIVAVTVDLDIQASQTQRTEYDNDKVAKVETEMTTETQEETSAAPPSGEPGAVPNLPMSVNQPAGGAGGTTSTREKTVTKIEPKFSSTVTQETKPAGKPKVVAATVRVPRSYFVSVWKMQNPGSTSEPDESSIGPLVQAETPRIKADVRNCTYIQDENAISVEPYTDVAPLLLATQTGGSGTGSAPSVSSLASRHAKEIALGALALVSLFMVSMMVRKGSPAPAVATAPAVVVEPPQFGPTEHVAGVVSGDSGTLDGMELDEDAIRAQQMVEQVSTMVRENPDAAANLVKRWLNRS